MKAGIKRDNTGTQRNLADAGIGLGMRVLELGCGNGEVTELLAGLVGPEGSVTALDRSDSALDAARSRLSESGTGNVRFLTADLNQGLEDRVLSESEPFDALVGRRVLLYLADPAATLAGLKSSLKPGAIVAFEEPGFNFSPRCQDSMPGHEKAMTWLKQMLDFEGAKADLGFSLPALFTEAGFEPKGIKADAVINGQGSQFPLAHGLKLMGSRVLQAGVASQEEIDELIVQLEEESQDRTKVFIMNLSFFAWAAKS